MTVPGIARWAAVALASASIGMAGVAAAQGNGEGTYRPGQGCGDRNHVHYQEDACHSTTNVGHQNDGRQHH